MQILRRSWQASLETFGNADPGRSAWIGDLADGWGIAAQVRRPGASVLKVLIAVAAHLADHEGAIALGEYTAVEQIGVSCWPSILDVFEPRHRLTLAEIIGLSLAAGDNRCADHLVRLLGLDRINRTAAVLGCTSTEVNVGFSDDVLNDRGRANLTTASDCARLLTLIREDQRFTDIRRAMSVNLVNTRIPSQLPAEIVVAHKTGSLNGVINDIGIISAGAGDLIVCFLTDAQADPMATTMAIGGCVREAFDAWESAA